MVVRVTVFGATGGASKASDKCSFAKVVEMERVDATGGASSSPTKSERDSTNAKQAERLYGECGSAFRGIVRM
mgnify:FL=1